jgi:hypothetical protein
MLPALLQRRQLYLSYPRGEGVIEAKFEHSSVHIDTCTPAGSGQRRYVCTEESYRARKPNDSFRRWQIPDSDRSV